MPRIALAVFLLCASILGAQAQDTIDNGTIIRMVQAGVPTNVIIQTIDSAQSVNFSFLPGALTQLNQYKVPEDVIRAMAGRDRRLNPTPAPAPPAAPQAPPPPHPQAAPAPQAPKLQPGTVVTNSPDEVFQDGGMLDLNFQGSVLIPHAGSSTTGFISANLGYFLSRGNEIGLGVSGLFVPGGREVILGGFYRYYFPTGNARILPFVGIGAGGDLVHTTLFGNDNHFAALAQAGLRTFVTKHVAIEAGYTLVYVRVKGVPFQDSSASQIAVGFAHVFGGN